MTAAFWEPLPGTVSRRVDRALRGDPEGFTGRAAWVDGELRPETNFMATAGPGEVAGGYVKSAVTRDGLDVWEKVA